MTAPGLRIQELRFAYPALHGGPGAAALFDGLSLQLGDGERAVLLAGADRGKTTLSRIVAGLVPRFSGGQLDGGIEAGGLDVRGCMPFEMVEAVGIVFQDPDEQVFTTRCDTEVAFALESLGVPRQEMERRVAAALEVVGLGAFRDRNPATLSGGEKKRLLVACLAAVNPRLWVLDEVFQELDDAWKSALVGLLRGRGRPALFLDSRWSPLYGGGFASAAVLRGGKLVPAGGGDGPGLLEQEGVRLPAGAPASRRPSAGAQPFLRLEAVRFSFPGRGSFGLRVDGLELRTGEVCALVGRNGSGKSTLARVLCGLAGPSAGAVRIREGHGFRDASSRELNCRVGYMFQNPDYQLFLPTVAEELALGLRAAGADEAGTGRRVQEAIAHFRLPPGDAPPALMSYGARKRLQAATYSLLERDLYILDEVDSGLSYTEVFPIIDALARGGAGLLMITHDAALARAAADRVVVIDDGRIVSDGPVHEAAWPGSAPGTVR